MDAERLKSAKGDETRASVLEEITRDVRERGRWRWADRRSAALLDVPDAVPWETHAFRAWRAAHKAGWRPLCAMCGRVVSFGESVCPKPACRKKAMRRAIVVTVGEEQSGKPGRPSKAKLIVVRQPDDGWGDVKARLGTNRFSDRLPDLERLSDSRSGRWRRPAASGKG